jgi:hypothetical protein
LEPDFGTGRQWRPLDQALEVLWQAGAWREELIQLLELLAERPLQQPQRRLHPLPWAYAACGYGVLCTDAPWIHREMARRSPVEPQRSLRCLALPPGHAG